MPPRVIKIADKSKGSKLFGGADSCDSGPETEYYFRVEGRNLV
jgi:hypothetical protein